MMHRTCVLAFVTAGTLATIAAGSALSRGRTGAPSAGEPAGTKAAPAKIPVKTADDLPRHQYAVTGKALDFINDAAKFNALVDKLIADAQGDLEKYDIADASTLREYYGTLSQCYLVKGDLVKAVEFSDKARALETKEQERLMRGVVLRGQLAGLKASPDRGDEKFVAAFKQSLRAEVGGLPYDLVKDQLINIRSQAKMISRGLIESSLSTTLDPLIEAGKGEVSEQVAVSLVQSKVTFDIALPLLPHMAAVYGEIIDSHATAKAAESKWQSRLVTLAATEKARPVVVGVWDSGVDTSLYPNNLWTNPKEKPGSADLDGNGFPGDVHGIAFGLDRRPTTGPLASLAGLKGDRDQLIEFIAASQDMQAGAQNERVTKFQEHIKALRGEALRDFTDDLSLIGSYAHGTHVAGIVVAGNPFARIVHITENWPWKSIPDEAPTIEMGQRWGESARQAVAYLKKADVRVVNMSWRVGRSAFEGMLASKGVGATPEERAELSRKIFKPLRDGLEEAIRSAPEILFIAGSGNEDNDVDFAEYVPAGLRLPNLLTVGAVDDQDRFTTFTTTGKSVELYANGYRIPSLVPGGKTIEFSGTSMASPQVANLAAKIFALRPELKPADVVALIRASADPIPDQAGRFIINPAKTIEALGSRK